MHKLHRHMQKHRIDEYDEHVQAHAHTQDKITGSIYKVCEVINKVLTELDLFVNKWKKKGTFIKINLELVIT